MKDDALRGLPRSGEDAPGRRMLPGPQGPGGDDDYVGGGCSRRLAGEW